MSFDLFVYVEDFSQEKVEAWEKKLREHHISCDLPQYDQLVDYANPIICKKLDSQKHPQTECEIYIDVQTELGERLEELTSMIDNEEIVQRLKKSKYEVSIYPEEGDELFDVQLKNYVTATMVDAFDGVLLDPQQFGAAINGGAYKIADFYTQAHQIQEVEPVNVETEPTPKNNTINIILVVILAIMVIKAIKNFI